MNGAALVENVHIFVVDCTDCIIYERSPFSFIPYSHKFHGPGVRYDISVSNYTGSILWIHCTFPFGLWNDLAKFKKILVNMLSANKCVIVDNGNTNTKFPTPDTSQDVVSEAFSGIRSRHKTVKTRI